MNLWDFAELEPFYERYAPQSPWGRRERDERRVFTDVASLNAELDAVGKALAFLLAAPDAAEEVSRGLGRLPLLPRISHSLDATELFLVKKFLVNAMKIWEALLPDVRDAFGIHEPPGPLLKLLGTDDVEGCQETFYLTESFSEGLREVRREIRSLDLQTRERRRRQAEDLVAATGIDIRFRDFVVLSAEKAKSLPLDLFDLEPCDSSHYLAKPRVDRETVDLAARREALLVREKAEEAEVLRMLSAAVLREREPLFGLAAGFTRLDVALAKATLARDHSLTRPSIRPTRRPSTGYFDIDAEGTDELPLVIEAGRLLPLAWECERHGLRYWPLSVTVDMRANVLLGSNMGGKTVVLKTIAFLQQLAQMGFYVPAARYETCLFAQVSCIVPVASGEAGLSSFGLEIVEIGEAWDSRRLPALFLVDEFARTTNSREATALVAALLRRFSESPGSVGIVSTHFMELRPEFCHMACFRMRGLNASLFRSFYETHVSGPLGERLRHLARCMEYEIVREERMPHVADALHVAAALGLDESILNYAKLYLEDTYAGKAGPEP